MVFSPQSREVSIKTISTQSPHGLLPSFRTILFSSARASMAGFHSEKASVRSMHSDHFLAVFRGPALMRLSEMQPKNLTSHYRTLA